MLTIVFNKSLSFRSKLKATTFLSLPQGMCSIFNFFNFSERHANCLAGNHGVWGREFPDFVCVRQTGAVTLLYHGLQMVLPTCDKFKAMVFYSLAPQPHILWVTMIAAYLTKSWKR